MTSAEIRTLFLEFFKKRGHAIIPSASLVTSDEKGVTNPTLFNTAGMQPLISYLLGKPYVIDGQEVKRLADVQKCLRTVDIDDVGDKTHATFFEMLGNWSLGDYFKKEAINWSYELLTSKSSVPGDRGFGLDPHRIYITVFEGDTNASRDDEAAAVWADVFRKNHIEIGGNTLNGDHGRIFYMSAEKNWWEAGDSGPCGPDTEMYYDVGDPLTAQPFFGGKTITKAQFMQADAKSQIVEVWNDVFMQYEKKNGKIVGPLPKPSVDTGAGLERLAMALATPPAETIYETDLLKPVMDKIQELVGTSQAENVKSARVVADHIKASVFLIADGVLPSNTDRGYVLRKLIRRAVRHADLLHIPEGSLLMIAEKIQDIYKDTYPDVLAGDGTPMREIIKIEESKFRETLKIGLREFEKGVDAFTLFSSYGFPLELTLEIAKEKGVDIDVHDFEKKFKAHQHVSRTGAEKKFKGGLADADDPKVIIYHTATHLLHQALHDVLGGTVTQKGSNITRERLRFDFSHKSKLTDEDKKKVEDIINGKIAESLPVNQITMSKNEAEKTGARHFFGEKYGNEVSVYFIGPVSDPAVPTDLAKAYSKEFCGGPHVKNTSELAGPEGRWRFKIQKEEAVEHGVRRIKAVLE